MKRKPKIGEQLLLLAQSSVSRAGFSIPVSVLDAHDRHDTLLASQRQLAAKCAVKVLLPWGDQLWVERRDLEPNS